MSASLPPWLERVKDALSPRLVEVRPLRVPVSVAGGLTPVKIVARGVGRLRLGSGPWLLVVGELDRVLLAPVAERVVVRFQGLFGSAERAAALGPLIEPAPRRVRSPTTAAPAPSVREPGRSLVGQLRVRRLERRAPPTVAPCLPALKTRSLRPRLSLPGEPS